ncbi:MAG TPA: tRNA lysidine(34) synthetase TilS [Candidatus Omnitrophota bacterium]|nr:tRNA lysidine(34) synthetase TilS [Candidatus Omnitrophota bacterium]
MSLSERVQSYCQKKHLFASGDTVVIGVSGGKDSVCLCHILVELRHVLGIELIIAHFNHRLRKSAGKDEAFVKELAKRSNLPFYASAAKKPLTSGKGSLEEKCRRKRFKFLTTLARRLHAEKIALAHTQDDLAETVLMRIIRGGGSKGLVSILPERTIDGVSFVRPLLNASQEEILSYLKTKKIPFRSDATNRQKKFFRNKIRLDVMPLLKKDYNPNIREVLAHLSQNLSFDYDFLHQEAEKAFKRLAHASSLRREIRLNTQALKKAHPALQRLLLRLSVEKLKGDTRRLTFKHMEEMEDLICSRPTGSVVHLPQRLFVQKMPHNIKLYISKT